MKRKVIVQFRSFDDRDRWVKEHEHISRIYKRNPWLAAELSDDELRQLKRELNVEVFFDTQMVPFSAGINP